ncbi:MAG: S8 family peptidase [Defluviitaleaceae bacterium]|nr:S8 family peptidase [Defluviitaleaceae bacterium]
MTIQEFANQPYVIQLYTKNGPAFANKVSHLPYVRVGKIVRGDYSVLYVDSRRINDLAVDLGTASAELFPKALTLLGRASLDASEITRLQQHPHLGLRGRGTLVGIIDTGIDFTKTAFIHEDGTSKIKYLWDQSIEGNSPDDFFFGSEFTNEQINQALQTDYPTDIVPSTDTVGHGTFLASVAASRLDSEYIGAAPDADLIVVKLRRMQKFFYNFYCLPDSQENVFSGVDVILAIEYMIDRALELKMPLAVCIGLGSNLAGHDSFSFLDQYISVVSPLTGICICTGAGNESYAGHHASGVLSETNEIETVQLRVPENANDFMLNVIVGPPDRMSVSLKSPTGEIIPRAVARSGSITETDLILEHSKIIVEYHFPVSGSGIQLIVVKILRPTPGIWDINLHGDIIVSGIYNIWLPITGLSSPGLQFLTPDPYVTVTVPGTSTGSITCGAYNHRDGGLYSRSSWGPTRIAQGKPDLVAPGVDVAGFYPVGNGTMTGTSVATAITAGACALMLQWGIVEGNDVSLNTNRIKAALIRGCRRETHNRYPNHQWGFGKLDLFNTFMQFRK